MRHRTVNPAIRCPCGHNFTLPVALGRDALRWLAQSGADPGTVISTCRCRRCGATLEQRLGDLVPWREAA